MSDLTQINRSVGFEAKLRERTKTPMDEGENSTVQKIDYDYINLTLLLKRVLWE